MGILIKLWPYLLVLTLLASGYAVWTDKEATIAKQKVELINSQITIDVMASNINEHLKEAESDAKRAVFDALIRDRKKRIEDLLKRDESGNVDTNSTRFYL